MRIYANFLDVISVITFSLLLILLLFRFIFMFSSVGGGFTKMAGFISGNSE